ncbi:unnamed protein product [Pedinophyceae sp. YPF-701]|nr:unnamed protein product [Pedinophyceae sp. YPF-701]
MGGPPRIDGAAVRDFLHEGLLNAQRTIRRLTEKVEDAVMSLDEARRGAQAMRARRSWAPAAPGFASLTMGRTRVSQPVCDVALAQEEIEDRLSTLSVYTVVNDNNEFVLVSGPSAGDADAPGGKQLGLFFMRREGAQGLLAEISRQEPGLAKSCRVLEVAMDKVYALLKSPQAKQPESGVAFRLVPAAEEVSHALKLYKTHGVNSKDFWGVPVFQAEGLTVTKDRAKCIPLFLSKSDLDAAVSSAFTRAELTKLREAGEGVRECEQEVERVKREVDTAATDKAKRRQTTKLERAESKLARAQKRYEDLRRLHTPPKVEVGSLEDVVAQMEGDQEGDWQGAVFVSPGSIAGSQPAEQPAKESGKGKRSKEKAKK